MQNSNIHLSLTINQDSEISHTEYQTDAKFLNKNNVWYLFYDEFNEESREKTQCRFEITQNSIRMRRNGPIIIEQNHEINNETTGYIKTTFGEIITRIITTNNRLFEIEKNVHKLELNYELYTGEELTGIYSLTINIKTGG